MSETLDHIYPGLDRLKYFLARVVLVVLTVFAVIYFGPESGVFRVVSLASMVAGVVLDVMRLRNIGVSQWLMFLRFVPYGGVVLDIGLQALQTGWIETRRLDRSGWMILGAYAALIGLVIFLVIRTPGLEVFGVFR